MSLRLLRAYAPHVLGRLVPGNHFETRIGYSNADAQTGQDCVHERVRLIQLVGPHLQFIVGRLELLVGRLELFVHRFQFLVGRLQLLVRRLELFVG